MKLLGNIVWWLFGGLLTAFEYCVTGVICCITIIGIPFGLQCFKLALLMLWPFGSTVSPARTGVLGCLSNVIWIFLGGIWIALTHVLFGLLLCVTIVGIPFGLKHFEFARLAFTPFGRTIEVNV